MSLPSNDNYLIRVSCPTFNHTLYITDAMNGFAMQQTSFPFVCTIIDDASTDGEQEVIQDYLRDHFDLQDSAVSYEKNMAYGQLIFARHKTNVNCHFAILLLRENHYSQHKSKAPYIVEWDRTKYVATCEGDDYWTDPLKLQKQVDYLEAHPECTLCFTNAIMRWEDGSGKPDRLFAQELEDRDYEGPEMTEEWITPTASFVYRRQVLDSDFYLHVISLPVMRIVGDIPLVLTCKHLGIVHGLSDVTCVYRRQPQGFMLSADSTRKIAHGDYRYAIYKVFGKEYMDSSVNKALYHYRIGLGYAKNERRWRNWFRLLGRIVYVYLRHPVCAAKRVLNIIREKRMQLSE